jgi:hypothetical protein
MKIRSSLAVIALLACAGAASGQVVTVFPTLPHAASNFIPFGSGGAGLVPTQHQVFASSLFSNASGGQPVQITRIAFAPGLNGVFNLGQVNINLGYTARTPGAAPPGGLDIPTQGGGGTPNAAGPMTEFYNNANTSFTINAFNANNFSEMVFDGTPFVYNPAQGNLLVEIVVPAEPNVTLHVSRAAGSTESSRAFASTRFGAQASTATATRMQFTFTVVQGCYADCNGDGVLNLADFGCFQTKFALGC